MMMLLKNAPIKLKIALGTGIPLLLLICLSLIAVNSSQNQEESNHMVDHTHNVIQQAMRVEGSAVDMETGMRGYLLAGKEGFLEPYIEGKRRFSRLVSELKTTVSDNPAQVQRLSDIEKNINDWLSNVTEPAIQLRRQIGDAKTMDDMSDLVGEAKGKVYFDKFREQVSLFINRERDLLDKRYKQNIETQNMGFKQLELLDENNKWTEHTHEVIRVGLNLTSAAVDMETGMRGFLLAGKEAFLEPYHSGKKRFFDITDELKKKVSDNPDQVSRIEEIEQNISSWNSNVTEPAIAQRRLVNNGQRSMDDIARLVGQAKGKQYFDRFREQISRFILTEEELIVIRKGESDQSLEGMSKSLDSFGESSEWVNHTHEVIETALDIQAAAVDMETGMRGFLLSGKKEFLEPYTSGKNAFQSRVEKQKQTVSDNPDQVALLDDMLANILEWQSVVVEPMIQLRSNIGDAKTMNDMAKLVGEARGKVYFDRFRSQIAEFIRIEDQLMKQRQEAAKAAVSNTTYTILTGTVIAVFLGAIISFLVIKAISVPVAEVANGLTLLAGGDLTARMSVDSNDELGQMAKSYNQAVSQTNNVIQQVLQTTDDVVGGSSKIVETSENMANELEQQSNQVTQIATSIDQMTLSIQEVAQKSADATSSAQEAGVTANSGGLIVKNTITGMNSINEAVSSSSSSVTRLGKSGAQIGEIINVIKEIAEQTNLLALNAAIEAARAGESGRGFAVVADEVRTLADRTTKATEEIGSSIEAIQNETQIAVDRMKSGISHVEDGMVLAGQAGTSLEDIVTGAENVASMIDSIAAATEEQSEATEEVSRNVISVSEVSKNANEAAKGAASSANELAQQAQRLKDLVAQFKVT